MILAFNLTISDNSDKSSVTSTGCPTKNYTLFRRAIVSLNFELGIKVGGVLESSGSQLFKTVPTFDF